MKIQVIVPGNRGGDSIYRDEPWREKRELNKERGDLESERLYQTLILMGRR